MPQDILTRPHALPAAFADRGDRAAAVTGLGAVTPIGVGVPAFTSGLRARRSGTRPLRIDPAHAPKDMKSTVAATCDDFDPRTVLDAADLARLPALIPMALAAAREALAHAGLASRDTLARDGGLAAHDLRLARRVGLILGTGGGGIDFTCAQIAAVHEGHRPSLWSVTNATHGNLAGEISIRLGLRGPSLCTSTGCASSSDAAGLALQLLRLPADDAGTLPDAWLVIGADAHVRPEILRGMELLKVISTRTPPNDPVAAAAASRPFDATRDGFVLGEGAWAAVLERPSFAAARGARAIGALLGYAATCDAFHRVRPDPEMTETVRAITGAVHDAGLRARDVSLVHYHGTATQMNDALETLAVTRAFADHAPALIGTSIKGAIGHPQGASGMASFVATLAAGVGADGGAPICPPTLNLRERDPACDLDYCAQGPRPLPPGPHAALVNCLAFGAKNSALVVGWDTGV